MKYNLFIFILSGKKRREKNKIVTATCRPLKLSMHLLKNKIYNTERKVYANFLFFFC